MSARDILQSIISNFELIKFEQFFREKNDVFTFPNEVLNSATPDIFEDGKKIAEAKFEDGLLIVCSFLVKKELKERSGKKLQYDLGKQILKQQQADAGIFIFYDSKGDFRFSLIYANYLGKKRDWSTFKRFTYFVSQNQTNKTFLKQIGEGDFSTIESIKEIFSVEKVTKEFYQELANWYFWAIDNCHFPNEIAGDQNARKIAIIRLITRMIFIWFMREKGLIPSALFEQKNIETILKNITPEESTYYLAILQNLFFATLSTKPNERKFRAPERYNKGYNKDFTNQYVFRYQDLFRNPEYMTTYFGNIPFLNGGLFECLDNGVNNIYIDGFTERKRYQPYVPNFLFFSEDEEVDLNSYYGTTNKSYKVKGLLNILSSFNFTIDENSSDDAEIALDPELLGRVFENLLASFNPETATTARKATGSYYTPREIVDYMTTEVLKEYLKIHLSKIQDIDVKLTTLFLSDNYENPFSESESKQIVNLLESVRIVDPAVGSGAFPMGILNKIVFILNKIDPANKFWREAQLKAADALTDPNLRDSTKKQIEEYFATKKPDYSRKLYLIQKCIYGVDIQEIAVEITKLRFFISLLVDEEEKDIQALPNLDFKIMQGDSLIELISYTKTNDHKRNEIVDRLTALKDDLFNTSDHMEKNAKRQEINKLLTELFEYDKSKTIYSLQQEIIKIKSSLRLSVFEDRQIKIDNEQRIKEIEHEIAEIQKTNCLDATKHFEWHINFSEVFQEKGGFDIVMGNPPYIQLQKAIDKKNKYGDIYKNLNYETFDRRGDIYCLFYEKGIQLLRDGGHLAYITSNKWMRAGYGEKLRNFFVKYNPKILIDLGSGIFESSTVDTNILIIQNAPNQNYLKAVTLTNIKKDSFDIRTQLQEKGIILSNLSQESWFIGSDAEQRLKEKIERIGKPLKEWDVKIYYGIKTGLNEAFIIDSAKREEILNNCKDENERKRTEAIIKPILRGRDIKRYYYEWKGLWVIIIPAGWTNENRGKENPNVFIEKAFPSLMTHLKNYEVDAQKRDDQGDYWWELRQCAYYSEFEKEKIVYGQFQNNAEYALAEKGVYLSSNEYMICGNYNKKYFLACLNSNLTKWFLKNITGTLGNNLTIGQKSNFLNFPIPIITDSNKLIVQQIETLVDKILAITKDKDYLQNSEKQAKVKEYERQIDQLVYRLYDFTPEEIALIENETKI